LDNVLIKRIRHRLRKPPHPDDDDLSPVSPPSGPSPMPLAGAAELEET
jgi:hypothetical protein